MDNTEINLPHTIGTIVKWVLICGISLGGVYILLQIFEPVYEQISHSIGLVSRSFRYARGGDVHSLAVLCVVIIGIVGLAKVLKK